MEELVKESMVWVKLNFERTCPQYWYLKSHPDIDTPIVFANLFSLIHLHDTLVFSGNEWKWIAVFVENFTGLFIQV